jgi:hypothetical protein
MAILMKILYVISSRFIVGTGNLGMNDALRMLDHNVQTICKFVPGCTETSTDLSNE